MSCFVFIFFSLHHFDVFENNFNSVKAKKAQRNRCTKMAKELDITIIATKIQRNKKSLIQALGVHLFAVIFL